MKLIAMGQFEAMIRYDANLRNYGKFDVYSHPQADDDGRAVVYIEIGPDKAHLLLVTRLSTTPLPDPNGMVPVRLEQIKAKHGVSYSEGLLAITSRYLRFNQDFSGLIAAQPLEALDLILNDANGYDLEYQSYNNPQAMKMAEGLYLQDAAKWIQSNNTQIRTYLMFRNQREDFIVLGRQFREESFLMLTSYNRDKKVAYFDGMIGGRPIHSRIALNPKSFQGDRLFVEHMERKNVLEQYGAMWRIRHLGSHVSDDGESFIRGPHIAGRDSRILPSAENYDFSENRIIVL